MKLFCKFLLSLIFFSSSILFSQESIDDATKKHDLIYKNVDKIQPLIKEYVEMMADGSTMKIEGEKIYATEVLKEFYKLNNYAPAWVDHDAWLDAFEALEGSFEDGLLPDDYHMDGMLKIIEKVKDFDDAGDFDFEWVAKFDLLMTDAILLYAYHLLEGKVDPHDLDIQWNFDYTELPGGDGQGLSKAIRNKTVSTELLKLRPQQAGYTMMMNELAKYREIAEKGGWGKISDGGKIDPGDADSRVPEIRKRLSLSDDLTDQSALASETYDASLEKDIRYFQEKHGLDSDGIIGKGTFGALNIPVEDKIDQLRVNLERSRWIMHNLSEDFILVNIARFMAYTVQNNEFTFSTNVQVGTYYNKTPVFKSKLKYIEFNPTWTVPRSITVNEMIPKIKKDHDYLKSKNMVLLDGSGKIVPFSSVDFDNISAKNFPYVIRQEPGPGNALGEVKFIFPNQYSVYLHDTPSKYLFDKASRSFSHGCIRTQNPLQLAEVLLKGTDWDKQKIQETLDSKQTARAYFDEPFDVLLLYWTAGKYKEESIFYFPDIYKRDKPILDKLDKEVEVVAFKKLKKKE